MTTANPKRWRRIEFLLWAVGIFCVGSFLLVQNGREASAQGQVERFLNETQAGSPSTRQQGLAGQAPDQELWSEQRIAAFNELAEESPARTASGVLRIPTLDLEVPVFEGTDHWALNRGVGWVPGTAPIDSSGNLAIAGHRDGFFRVLKDIDDEDIIEVVGPTSTTRYRVTDTWIVDPDAVHVLDPTEEASVTLVTCYPFYFVGPAPQRFIVRATAVESS